MQNTSSCWPTLIVNGGGRLVVVEQYNVTLYAANETFKLTVTEVLVTKKKLVCADSERSYLKI